jgi:dolichol kinase
MPLTISELTRFAILFTTVIAFQAVVARFPLEREAKRRWQHALTGHAMVQISYILPPILCKLGLFMGAIVIWYFRTYQSEHFLKAVGPIMRPHELAGQQLPTAFYFAVGCLITIALFPMPIARYAVECLSLADPLAAWFGQSIASPRITKSSSVAGSSACFVAAWMIGWMFFYKERSLLSITLGACGCTISEALPFTNDNLIIPIVTAFSIQLVP